MTLADAKTTVIQQHGIEEVIAAAASESSACTVDTGSKQDGHVSVKCPV